MLLARTRWPLHREQARDDVARIEVTLSGPEVAALSDEALAVRVREVDAFGRLTPDQKVRVVRALKANGAVVGFLGDGINDAPAIRTADVGISVDTTRISNHWRFRNRPEMTIGAFVTSKLVCPIDRLFVCHTLVVKSKR